MVKGKFREPSNDVPEESESALTAKDPFDGEDDSNKSEVDSESYNAAAYEESVGGVNGSLESIVASEVSTGSGGEDSNKSKFGNAGCLMEKMIWRNP